MRNQIPIFLIMIISFYLNIIPLEKKDIDLFGNFRIADSGLLLVDSSNLFY